MHISSREIEMIGEQILILLGCFTVTELAGTCALGEKKKQRETRKEPIGWNAVQGNSEAQGSS